MTHTSIKDLEKEENPSNWLFFSARNLAIELCLRDIRDKLVSDLKLKNEIEYSWLESSIYHPTLRFIIKHKRNVDKDIYIEVPLSRDTIHPAPRYGSCCIYSNSFGSLMRNEARTKKELMIDAYIRSDIFGAFVRDKVGTVNYPFPYKHYSGF